MESNFNFWLFITGLYQLIIAIFVLNKRVCKTIYFILGLVFMYITFFLDLDDVSLFVILFLYCPILYLIIRDLYISVKNIVRGFDKYINKDIS